MFYKDGFFWGMHLIWWAIWIVALGWIFFAPTSSSYEEIEGDDPLMLLKIQHLVSIQRPPLNPITP